jgi:SAM-dependent methyltransferase
MQRGALIADQVVRNLLMAFPPLARWRTRRGRTAERGAVDAAYLHRYAYEPYEMLLAALGVSALAGRRVGEIGPGDHVPAALLLLAAGARDYTAFDRFPGDVAGARAKQLYGALARDLAAAHPGLAAGLRERGIDAARFPDAYPELVRFVHGPIESLHDAVSPGLDVLFSYNVVEHLSDVAALARASERLLAPRGVAVHRVDFGPHDVWFARGSDLEWLTIPDTVWRWMGSRRGAPNRLRYHEVVEQLARPGLRVEARVLERFDEAALRAAQPTLARRFRAMPLDSLRVKTALILCRKERA